MTVLSSTNGDIDNPPRIVTGHIAILQRVRQRLNTLKGEWILDTTIGLDVFNEVLPSSKTLSEKVSAIEETAYTIEGVQQATVVFIKPTRRDKNTRGFTINIEVITNVLGDLQTNILQL